MARGDSTKVMAIGLVGFAMYSIGQQPNKPLGETIYNITKGIQRLLHQQTGDPGALPDPTVPTDPTAPCTVPPFSEGNYVEYRNGVYNCVRNGVVVFSSPIQSKAEQYYNYSYCPTHYPMPM